VIDYVAARDAELAARKALETAVLRSTGTLKWHILDRISRELRGLA
jgi:hypothetical protein